jgi:hypothetical protein
MDRLLMTDAPAPDLLRDLQAQGFELAVKEDRLRIRPADRLTPALRDLLARRKAEILALLAPTREYVDLPGLGFVARPALQLAWSLEARGFGLRLGPDDQVIVEPARALTDQDRAALHRWRRHIAAVFAHVNAVQ